MKILLVTTPIRPVPTSYPPFGSLAIIQSLRQAGHDPFFLDIDGLRPSFSQVIARIRRYAPDVLLVSAVVSTAYAYVKQLVAAVHTVLPHTRIVVGGNLAASAALLHGFGVDVCVIGEGERVIVDLMNSDWSRPGLSAIRGITYADLDGGIHFTGYAPAIPATDFLDPDFSILETHSRISNYITRPDERADFAQDPRTTEAHRRGKTLATVVSSKGCVARCTFCHRWDKGFRQIPPAAVIGRIRYLMARYNVGFIQFGDENFGSDRKALDMLLEKIAPLDILWTVAGVRARTVDFDLLKRMRAAGCVAAYYGFETGSPDMLKVMEKNLDLHHNLDAARWTRDAGLYTCYQLVLAMPGETSNTIKQTIQMIKTLVEPMDDFPLERLSVNYIQALPGTPVYEHARQHGLISDEDTYLRQISDSDANDDEKFINFTDYPYLVVRSWRLWLCWDVVVHWYRCGHRRLQSTANGSGGYFNLQQLAMSPGMLSLLNPFKWPLIYAYVLWTEYRHSGLRMLGRRLAQCLRFRSKMTAAYASLRRTVNRADDALQPLRDGR